MPGEHISNPFLNRCIYSPAVSFSLLDDSSPRAQVASCPHLRDSLLGGEFSALALNRHNKLGAGGFRDKQLKFQKDSPVRSREKARIA